MVVFGLILLLIGLVLTVKILWSIGLIVLLVGLVGTGNPGPLRRKAKAPLLNPLFSLILGRCAWSHRSRIVSYPFVRKTI